MIPMLHIMNTSYYEKAGHLLGEERYLIGEMDHYVQPVNMLQLMGGGGGSTKSTKNAGVVDDFS